VETEPGFFLPEPKKLGYETLMDTGTLRDNILDGIKSRQEPGSILRESFFFINLKMLFVHFYSLSSMRLNALVIGLCRRYNFLLTILVCLEFWYNT